MNARRARSICPTPSKQSWPDEQSAQEALEAILDGVDLNLLPSGVRLPRRVYHCSCRRYHLTSTLRPHRSPYDPH